MAMVDQMNDFAAALGDWEACMFKADDFTPAAGPPPGLEMMGVPAKVLPSELPGDWPADAMGAPVAPDAKMYPAKLIIAPVEDAPVKPADCAAAATTKEQRKLSLEPVCSDCGTDEPGWGKFCMECGSKRKELVPPACGCCGTADPGKGKFCMECGTRRQPEDASANPAAAPLMPIAAPCSDDCITASPLVVDEDLLKMVRTANAMQQLENAMAELSVLAAPEGHMTAAPSRSTLKAAAFCPSALTATGLSASAPPFIIGSTSSPAVPCTAPAMGKPAVMVKAVNQYVVPGETIRTHLKQLQDVAADRVLLVRKINRLGFESDAILKDHYSFYGNVENVFVSHSRVKAAHNAKKVVSSRVRPSGMGFVVMSTAEEAQLILAAGSDQVVQGANIHVQSYEHHQMDEENPQDGADTAA
eukprot:TRINITY_DN36714_c0_g1_i2.p1 TRINITY_DN36714_c0_g1~~TRINITY_DN36714_c0_g1_i2.p1  ORF type:complete len:416 (-),score=95.54 TRINITY_DN36714_c0_g1_i2:268-1515(-)